MRVTLFTLFTLISIASFSQKNINWCDFDYQMQQNLKNAAFKSNLDKTEAKLLENDIPYNTKSSPATVIIPTVVHVMHRCGSSNISKAQIDSALAILNRDYQRTNSDTSDTRAQFKPLAAGSSFEFRLANIDPNGDATEGITRHYTDLTTNANDQIKQISMWDYEKYFNIWVVEDIELQGNPFGRVLGRAVFPTGTSQSVLEATYGFLVVHDEFGNVGTASGSESRTATHEIGHCFGLYHTFDAGVNGNNCNAGLCETSGDKVCDTPPSLEATFFCDMNQNTCSNDMNGGSGPNPNPFVTDEKDMNENYMSYDDCQNMFTLGQVTRMESMTGGLANHLNLLSSPANAVATGTNTPPAFVGKPVADFCYDVEFGCETGTTVNFTDISYNDSDETDWSWLWNFGDGNTSISKNPTHTYTEFGKFSVQLTVTNTQGSGTTSKIEIIDGRAVSGGQTAPFNEGFEYNVNFPEDVNAPRLSWIYDQSDNGTKTWERIDDVTAYTGNVCLGLRTANVAAGETRGLISPTIDMTSSSSGCDSLKFNYAYAQNAASNNDHLKVFFSFNCGENWDQQLWNKSGSALSTVAPQGSIFFPNEAADWTEAAIPISAFYASQSNFRFKIELLSDQGNYLYIDNINVGCLPLGIEELNHNAFALYPNPSNGDAYINFNSIENQNVTVEVINVMGKVLSSNSIYVKSNDKVSLEALNAPLTAGVYLIKVRSENSTITKRLIKY